MQRQPNVFLATVLAVTAGMVFGCAPSSELEPMDEATEVPTADDAAITSSQGVEMVARADHWEGDEVVEHFTTPVHVTIRNDSDHDLMIRYPNFALLGAYDRYAVLPPFVLETTDDQTDVAAGTSPVNEPLFSTEGFEVAPYYAPAYPNLVGYDGLMIVDLDYHTRYMTEWTEIEELPTDEMRTWALPEGVLTPGAELTGFLFFEHVDPDEVQLNLYFELEDATDHDFFGGLWIPYELEGPFEP